eukprot:GHVP01008540.1.p1 GENE.GHVP01008540.1~~GHVP01008540.1.p1  ORF type:complete len:146 (-),score=36.31 GHVP01008540.1:514-951(-)
MFVEDLEFVVADGSSGCVARNGVLEVKTRCKRIGLLLLVVLNFNLIDSGSSFVGYVSWAAEKKKHMLGPPLIFSKSKKVKFGTGKNRIAFKFPFSNEKNAKEKALRICLKFAKFDPSDGEKLGLLKSEIEKSFRASTLLKECFEK